MKELIETYPEMKERHKREMIALLMRFNEIMTINQAATANGMNKDKLRKLAYDNGISFLRAYKKGTTNHKTQPCYKHERKITLRNPPWLS